jgi:hypothetical protein
MTSSGRPGSHLDRQPDPVPRRYRLAAGLLTLASLGPLAFGLWLVVAVVLLSAALGPFGPAVIFGSGSQRSDAVFRALQSLVADANARW